ncbi:MAG TPA: SIMPL domain-containing protein [Allosphingosinicella sp.]
MAALAMPVPAAAQSSLQALLAPGEVLLEVAATGTSVRPAERARLLVSIIGRGASPEEARAGAEAQVQRVTAASLAAGVPRDAISEARHGTRVGFVAEGFDEDMIRADLELAAAIDAPRGSDTRLLQIVIADPARAASVANALRRAGIQGVADPIYQVMAESAARGAARADALRRARAEADSYAAAANMRVVRMLRINARPGAEAIGWSVYAGRLEGTVTHRPATDVETTEAIGVDFVLGPR